MSVECLLCFETIEEQSIMKKVCPSCNKAWCATCNERWKHQQKYSLGVPVTCPFCRAVIEQREPASELLPERREEHLSFIDRMIRYTVSVFALGLLITLPIIELVYSKSYVLLSAFMLTLILILLLLVLQGYLYRRYIMDQTNYRLDEDSAV